MAVLLAKDAEITQLTPHGSTEVLGRWDIKFTPCLPLGFLHNTIIIPTT
jgi:hypothetical protein